jgi:hypothetical protein
MTSLLHAAGASACTLCSPGTYTGLNDGCFYLSRYWLCLKDACWLHPHAGNLQRFDWSLLRSPKTKLRPRNYALFVQCADSGISVFCFLRIGVHVVVKESCYAIIYQAECLLILCSQNLQRFTRASYVRLGRTRLDQVSRF